MSFDLTLIDQYRSVASFSSTCTRKRCRYRKKSSPLSQPAVTLALPPIRYIKSIQRFRYLVFQVITPIDTLTPFIRDVSTTTRYVDFHSCIYASVLISLPLAVRRVVTTHDATGASAFLHDGPAPTTLMIPALGDLSPVFSHVWTTASLPVDNQDDTDWAQAATEGKTVRPGGGRMDFPGLGW